MKRIVVEYPDEQMEQIDTQTERLGVTVSQYLRTLVEVEGDSERVVEVIEHRKRVLGW